MRYTFVEAMVRQVTASDCTSQTSWRVQIHSAITKLEGLESVELWQLCTNQTQVWALGFLGPLANLDAIHTIWPSARLFEAKWTSRHHVPHVREPETMSHMVGQQ